MFRYSILGSSLLAAAFASAEDVYERKIAERAVIVPANPIKVASSSYVGLRNSSNTEGMRDLGFMGNIGNTWMLSFGDGVGTKNHNTFDPNAPVCSATGTCAYITARDGGAVQGNDPLSYTDIGVVYNSGCCGNIPEMDYWCPKIAGEDANQGLGITNVVAINNTHGVIYTRPTVSGTDFSSSGAGLAVVQLVSGGNPKCTRPFGKSTWTGNEPDWGQLSAISDGTFVYAYANGYDNGNKSQENHYVLVTRAPLTGAFDINQYQYWNGSAWTPGRVYIPYLRQNDNPYYLVGLNETGQGSVFYSSYYKKYVYINTGVSLDNHNVYAWVANAPQGPWSAKTVIWNDPGIAPNGGFMYGGYIMPKFTSSDGKTIYFSYTKGAIYEFVIKVTFA